MARRLRVCAGVVPLLLALVAPAGAEEKSALRKLPDQVFDVLLVRPIGIAGLAAGAGFFAIAAPFTAPTVGVRESWEVFVEEPFRFAFQRALGDLDDL